MGHQGTVVAQTITADPSSLMGWVLLLGLVLFMVIMVYVMWKSSK